MTGEFRLPEYTDVSVGNTKPMSIQGRLARERERLLGMTPEERRWRKQWVQDQNLSPNEPRHVPEIYKELNNPIRRIYKAPLDFLFSFTKPVLGAELNAKVRYITGKLFIIGYVGVLGLYWVKYNTNSWERYGGWRMISSKPRVMPGDPGYPSVSTKTPQEYNEQNFNTSPI